MTGRFDSSTGSVSEGGYDPTLFDQLARIEDKHFWFRARNRLIHNLTRKICSSFGPSHLVLEVGCGTGNVLRVLEKACPNSAVIGMELWLDGLRYAGSRTHAALVQADVRNWPFRKQVDLVGMFDVLEHIPEDRETLHSLWQCIAPGGYLLLTVPAHQFLWSYFDEAAHHCRRYSQQEIRGKLTDAGFNVEFLSYFMGAIFPLVWIFRKLRGRTHGGDVNLARSRTSDEFRLVPVMNPVLTALLSLEASWLVRGHRLPWGTSLVAIARKPL